MTREQAAAMLVNAAKLEAAPGSGNFTDLHTVFAGAKKAVNIAYAHKLIGGYQDGTFRPKNPATRAEAVTIILRGIQ